MQQPELPNRWNLRLALRMSTAPNPELNDRHRECLALVYVGRESKEIAALLNLSPGTVDGYLKAASKRLGVSGRRAAAAAYAQASPDELRRILQRLDVTSIPLADQQLGLADRGVATARPALSRKHFGLPVPTRERRWNDLPGWQRIGWSVAIGIGSLLVVTALISSAHLGLTGLSIRQ